MKRLLIILLSILVMFTGVGCKSHVAPTPTRAFVVPSRKVKKHWGAMSKVSVRKRYWSAKRYGPRPHPNRGKFR